MTSDLLQRTWQDREEVVYPRLFGEMGDGIYPVPAEVFSDVFQQEPDPRWLHIGVFASPPTGDRSILVYVSSGLSNPWDSPTPPADPDSASGLGLELVFATPDPGDWAIRLVHRILAFELLLSHGRYPGREPLGVGDRIPLRGPIVPGTDSELTWLLLCPPARFPDRCALDSGHFALLELVGATEAEAALSRDQGLSELLPLLEARGARAVTDPARRCVLSGVA